MPPTRVLPASRAARTRRGSGALRIGRKPTYMARLLAGLYSHYQENGRSYISEDDLFEKIREEANDIGDDLGKRFSSTTTKELGYLRRNHYVECRNRLGNKLRITENMETILETVDDALDGYPSLTEPEIYRLKCEYLRNRTQSKARNRVTLAELDKENRILEDDNRRLVQEKRELETELADLREEIDEPSSSQAQQPLQRQDAMIIDQQQRPEAMFTESMYGGNSTFELPTTQPLERQISTQTPARQPSLQNAASSYMTPESPPGVGRSRVSAATRPLGIARTDSHLFTPPATPEPPRRAAQSRSPTPASMHGASDNAAFQDDDDDDPPLQDESMDFDPAPVDLDIDMRSREEDEDQNYATPSFTLPVIARRQAFVFPTPENTPLRPQRLFAVSEVQTESMEVPSQPCVDCVARREDARVYSVQGIQTEPIAEERYPCANCVEKDTIIADQRTMITRLEIAKRRNEIALEKEREKFMEVCEAQATLEVHNADLRRQLQALQASVSTAVREPCT